MSECLVNSESDIGVAPLLVGQDGRQHGRVPGGFGHQRHQEEAPDWGEYCQLSGQPGQQHREVATIDI